MIYPLPTQPPPLDPPKLEAKVPEHIPYPPVTTGQGVPARIAPIELVRIGVGQTHQLKPVLLDCFENEQKPTERFSYSSNNPRVLVTDGGLIATNLPASVVSRRGAGEIAKITIVYGSAAPVTTIADVFVSADFDHVVSD
jgi:hypothetical protein